MLVKSLYEIIDKIIPPSLKVEKSIQDSLLRLESLSACAIVRDAHKSRILSKIPKELHPVIWKAFLRNEYYINRDSASDPEISGLLKLLQHWPHEAFIIKEVMPSSPAKLSWFQNSWDGTREQSPFYQNQFYLDKFYMCVAYSILENFVENKSPKNGILHNDSYKIRKLDISGTIIIELAKLSKVIKPYEDLFGDDIDKLEIILDLDCSKYYEGEQLTELELTSLADYYTNSVYSIIKCGHLELYDFNCAKSLIQIIENSLLKGTKSIDFGIDPEFDNDIPDVNIYVSEVVHGVYKSTSDQISILSFGLQVEVESISFLQYFKNLERLTIRWCDLNGELDPLLYLEKGLQYLSLETCNLDDSDLEVLLRSSHKTSLFELRLGFSYFVNHDNNLIKLCQELTNVIILKLNNCSLEEMDVNSLHLLFDSLKSLPNLAYFDFTGNIFEMDNVKSYMISLSASPSLRYIELEIFHEMSSEKNTSAIKSFFSHINSIVNKDRYQLLYVDFGVQVCYFKKIR